MKRIDDIKAVIYNKNDTGNSIVKKFLTLNDKHFFIYKDEDSLNTIIYELKKSGYKSKEVIILKNFKGRIFQKCPGSINMICCNYLLLNICFGCLYNCTYCFLNVYLNSFGIVQFINIENITDEIKNYISDNNEHIYRIGTGEFTDSLMMDEVTGFSQSIISEIKEFKNVVLELKTKSDNIDHLLHIKNKGNTVLAWSLNTRRNIDIYELDTASLDNRISAAYRAYKGGYFLAFHFDPIIKYDNFLDDYLNIIDMIFKQINPCKVLWISLGCFRYSSGFKEIINQKFPDEKLTVEEMFPGIDGKYRYLKHERIAIYRKLKEKIYTLSKKTFIYLCMESRDVWNAVCNVDYNDSDELEKAFSRHLKENFFLEEV